MTDTLDTEHMVLGAIIRCGAIEDAVPILQPEDFAHRSHQKIYRVCCDLYEQSTPSDLTTVADLLKKRNDLDLIGGRVYLADLCETVATAHHLPAHAKIIKDASTKRRIVSVCETAIQQVGGEKTSQSIIESVSSELFKMGGDDTTKRQFRLLGPLGEEELHNISAEMVEKVSTRPMTGLGSIDNLMGGFDPETLHIIAGDTSHGKTQLALQIARNVAETQDYPVGFISLEMTSNELARRLLVGETDVDPMDIRLKRLKDKDFVKLGGAAHRLRNIKLYLLDTFSLTPANLRSRLMETRDKYGFKMMMVDYLQNMVPNGKAENRNLDVAAISRSLLSVAKEMRIPIIALSQLSRPKDGVQQPPKLNRLRDSGSLEQDANSVLFVWRQMVGKPEDPEEKKYKNYVIIGKCRNARKDEFVQMSFLRGRWGNLSNIPKEVEYEQGRF